MIKNTRTITHHRTIHNHFISFLFIHTHFIYIRFYIWFLSSLYSYSFSLPYEYFILMNAAFYFIYLHYVFDYIHKYESQWVTSHSVLRRNSFNCWWLWWLIVYHTNKWIFLRVVLLFTIAIWIKLFSFNCVKSVCLVCNIQF